MQLTELLGAHFTYSSDAGRRELQRTERALIHAEFLRRGVAPAWRGDRGDPLDTESGGGLRRRDSQFIDILWRGHADSSFRVVPTGKRAEFHDLFGPGGVNYETAWRFVAKGYGYRWKVVTLGLTPIDQAELATIKHPAVKDAVKPMRTQRDTVQQELLRAYHQHPKFVPGLDRAAIRAQAERRADFWLAFVLANGSPKVAAQIYANMRDTAGDVDEGLLKAQRRSIKRSLEFVSSRYAGMMEGLAPDHPWWKLLKTATDLEKGRKG